MKQRPQTRLHDQLQIGDLAASGQDDAGDSREYEGGRDERQEKGETTRNPRRVEREPRASGYDQVAVDARLEVADARDRADDDRRNGTEPDDDVCAVTEILDPTGGAVPRR